MTDSAIPTPCSCGNPFGFLSIEESFLGGEASVTCPNCGSRANGVDRASAIAAWNRGELQP